MIDVVGGRPALPRSLAASVVLCLAVAAALFGGSAPAKAADVPVLSNLQTFLVGRVTGTVSTTSPYVRVRLGTSKVASGALPVTDGAADFNLPTWGFASTTVQAVSCSGTDPGDCDTSAAESTSFRTRDAHATFNLSPTQTVANDQRPYVNVTDNQGGGVLRIVWTPDDPSARTAQQDVNHVGTTRLDFLASADTDGDGIGDTSQVDDGTGTLVLWRCAGAADPDQCRVESTFGDGVNPMSQRVEIDHSVWATGSVLTDTIAAAPTTLVMPIVVSDPGSYHLAWRVVPTQHQTVVLASGTQDFVADGTPTDVSLPVNQLDGGTYTILADLTRHSDLGTPFASRVTATRPGSAPTFAVDQTAPVGAQLTGNHHDLFPVQDGYLDSIGFTLSGQHETWTGVQLELQRDSDFTVVHTAHVGDVSPSTADVASPTGGEIAFPVWDGRNDATGAVVPPGSYTALATLYDVYGNVARLRSTFWVDTRRLVTHTWHRTIAGRSLVAQQVGTCSAVVAPSSHHWAGSVTMAASSRARCHASGAAARSVLLTYASAVPTIPTELPSPYGTQFTNPGRYLSVGLRAYGGASLGRRTRSSVATMRWLDAAGRTGAALRMSAGLGWRALPTSTATSLMRRDHTVRWTTSTAGTNSYDVRSFELTVTYTNLE